MTLSKNSRLLRFAYLSSDTWPKPSSVSLCALFWRIVFRLLIVAGIIFSLGTVLTNWEVLMGLVGAALLIATLLASFAGFFFIQSKVKEQYQEGSLVMTALWGIKNKVCPIIKIADE